LSSNKVDVIGQFKFSINNRRLKPTQKGQKPLLMFRPNKGFVDRHKSPTNIKEWPEPRRLAFQFIEQQRYRLFVLFTKKWTIAQQTWDNLQNTEVPRDFTPCRTCVHPLLFQDFSKLLPLSGKNL
jgi:hypothetical protein